jgi:hypothetical protein
MRDCTLLQCTTAGVNDKHKRGTVSALQLVLDSICASANINLVQPLTLLIHACEAQPLNKSLFQMRCSYKQVAKA